MNLSSENRLLLYCAQTKIPEDKLNKVKDIISLPLNWEEVLKSALWHHIAPLLYHNLKDIQGSHFIPQEIMDQLRKAYYGNLVRNMNIYAELKRILDVFRENGIKVIVLKGAALAETVYANIGLRQMNDIDLLVREQGLDRAEELMAELGYISYEGYQFKYRHRRNYHHLAPFYNPENLIKIEVHHDIIPPGNPFHIDIQKLWDRAQHIIIEDVKTLALFPEDLLIHLCLHLSYSEPFKREISKLVDISQVVSFYGDRINWDFVIREAYEGKFTFFIYYPLYLAREVLDVKIEEKILNAFKTGYNLKPFEERLLMLPAKKNFLLRDESSSIFPKWFLQGLFQALCRAILYESGTHKKIGSLLKSILLPRNWSPTKISHTSTQGLSYLFYPTLRLLKLTFKFCYLLGRSVTKDIFRKMGLKFTH